MPFGPINLAIVDDHALFRKTLRNYLSGQEGINVTLQAKDAFDLLNRMPSAAIDVLVMDLIMPGLSGNDAIRLIRENYPEIKILVLSMSEDMNLISELLETGIYGYISKADEPEDLVQAIRAASGNMIYHNRVFTEALYLSRQLNIKSHKTGLRPTLNDREKRILQLIWEEKSNKEIGDELFLGVRSVEKIRQDLKEKLSVKSTIGLLKYAIDEKIIHFNGRIPKSASDLIGK